MAFECSRGDLSGQAIEMLLGGREEVAVHICRKLFPLSGVSHPAAGVYVASIRENRGFVARVVPRAGGLGKREVHCARWWSELTKTNPGLVRIAGGVQTDEFEIIVMERGYGDVLAIVDWGARTGQIESLPRSEAARTIAEQGSTGLGRMHAAGFAHRDVSPENVIFWGAPTQVHRVAFIDWGDVMHVPSLEEAVAAGRPAPSVDNSVGKIVCSAPEMILSAWRSTVVGTLAENRDARARAEPLLLNDVDEALIASALPRFARRYHPLAVDTWAFATTLFVTLFGVYPFHETPGGQPRVRRAVILRYLRLDAQQRLAGASPGKRLRAVMRDLLHNVGVNASSSVRTEAFPITAPWFDFFAAAFALDPTERPSMETIVSSQFWAAQPFVRLASTAGEAPLSASLLPELEAQSDRGNGSVCTSAVASEAEEEEEVEVEEGKDAGREEEGEALAGAGAGEAVAGGGEHELPRFVEVRTGERAEEEKDQLGLCPTDGVVKQLEFRLHIVGSSGTVGDDHSVDRDRGEESADEAGDPDTRAVDTACLPVPTPRKDAGRDVSLVCFEGVESGPLSGLRSVEEVSSLPSAVPQQSTASQRISSERSTPVPAAGARPVPARIAGVLSAGGKKSRAPVDGPDGGTPHGANPSSANDQEDDAKEFFPSPRPRARRRSVQSKVPEEGVRKRGRRIPASTTVLSFLSPERRGPRFFPQLR